eukprot:3669029-Rhodomonas_salina.1
MRNARRSVNSCQRATHTQTHVTLTRTPMRLFARADAHSALSRSFLALEDATRAGEVKEIQRTSTDDVCWM